MIIWLLLYGLGTTVLGTLVPGASASGDSSDPSVEEFCYGSTAEMKQSLPRLKFILVPADKIQENGKCLTVTTAPHRRELLQNYARRVNSSVQISFSSANLKQESCKIKVEKIKAKNLKSTSVGVNTEFGAAAGSEESDQNIKGVSSILTLKNFELTVNEDTVKGTCHVLSPDRYSIELEVLKMAKPLLPPVPPNTVVIIPDAQIPKIQETSRLVTSLEIIRGQRVEIGSVVKELKENRKNVDISSGGNLVNVAGAASEKIYLFID